MADINMLREQAKKERREKAAAQRASLHNSKYSNNPAFNLEKMQPNDETFLAMAIKTVLGDFDTFASAIRSGKTDLLLGLDSSIPGTPEVKDVDFHGRNGIEYPTLVAAKRGSLGNSSSFTVAAKQRPPSLAMPKNTKDAEIKTEKILEEMTQQFPALTDIETPVKSAKQEFAFPKVPDAKVKSVGKGSKNRTHDKRQSRNGSQINRGRKGNISAVEREKRSKKEAPCAATDDHKKSASSSSSDESSSDSSDSSDDDSHKIPVDKICAASGGFKSNVTPSANTKHIASPSAKTNNNYIVSKDVLDIPSIDKLSPENSRLYNTMDKINRKDVALNNINSKDVSRSKSPLIPNEDHQLNNLLSSNNILAPLLNSPQNFTMDMDIEKPISPLFDEMLLDDLLIPPSETKPDELSSLSNNVLASFNSNLDNEFDASVILNSQRRIGNLYQKDRKNTSDTSIKLINSKSKNNNVSVQDSRNKSGNKVNETKDKSKSKTARLPETAKPQMSGNSNLKIQTKVKTKAELKYTEDVTLPSVSKNRPRKSVESVSNKRTKYNRQKSREKTCDRLTENETTLNDVSRIESMHTESNDAQKVRSLITKSKNESLLECEGNDLLLKGSSETLPPLDLFEESRTKLEELNTATDANFLSTDNSVETKIKHDNSMLDYKVFESMNYPSLSSAISPMTSPIHTSTQKQETPQDRTTPDRLKTLLVQRELSSEGASSYENAISEEILTCAERESSKGTNIEMQITLDSQHPDLPFRNQELVEEAINYDKELPKSEPDSNKSLDIEDVKEVAERWQDVAESQHEYCDIIKSCSNDKETPSSLKSSQEKVVEITNNTGNSVSKDPYESLEIKNENKIEIVKSSIISNSKITDNVQSDVELKLNTKVIDSTGTAKSKVSTSNTSSSLSEVSFSRGSENANCSIPEADQQKLATEKEKCDLSKEIINSMDKPMCQTVTNQLKVLNVSNVIQANDDMDIGTPIDEKPILFNNIPVKSDLNDLLVESEHLQESSAEKEINEVNLVMPKTNTKPESLQESSIFKNNLSEEYLLLPDDICSDTEFNYNKRNNSDFFNEKYSKEIVTPCQGQKDTVKLTVKIPLQSIKLKDRTPVNHKNRTFENINDRRLTENKHSSASGLSRMDVTGNLPKTKRKFDICEKDMPTAKKVMGDLYNCSKSNKESNLVKPGNIAVGDTFVAREGEFEKLLVKINLSKLQRTPRKQAVAKHNNPRNKDPEAITRDDTGNTKKEPADDEKETLPKQLSIHSGIKEEKTGDKVEIQPKQTKSTHTEVISSTAVLENTLEYDQGNTSNFKKRRGRPTKEKPDMKDVQKTKKSNFNDTYSGIEENTKIVVEEKEPVQNGVPNNFCRECGYIFRDPGRDNMRAISYKKSYEMYLEEGRRTKRRADCLPSPTDRAHTYIDAVLNYVQYLTGLDYSGKLASKTVKEEFAKLCAECIALIDHVINHYGRKLASNYDARFVFLCLRLKSILNLRLFGLKKEMASRHSKILSEYYKQIRSSGGITNGRSQNHQSVPTQHNRGSTSTPSPSSPSPGPSPRSNSSVASMSSAGSNSSATNMAGPCTSVSIPVDMYEKSYQYLQQTKYLFRAHGFWEEAESLLPQIQDFVTSLSRNPGTLSMQSSLIHVVDFVKQGLTVIKESPKT